MDHPDTTYTLASEEIGTYEIGDKVTLGGITFEVDNIIHERKVKLRWAPTKWEIFKHWLKIKHTFPSWLLVRSVLPFMPNHKWYPRRKQMTQIDWHLKATPFTKQTDALIWMNFFMILWILALLNFRT